MNEHERLQRAEKLLRRWLESYAAVAGSYAGWDAAADTHRYFADAIDADAGRKPVAP